MLRSSCFYTAESETAIIADYNLNKRHRKYLVRNIFLFFFSHFHLRGVIAFRHFENIMNILKDMWEKVEYIFLERKQFIEQNLKIPRNFYIQLCSSRLTKGNCR